MTYPLATVVPNPAYHDLFIANRIRTSTALLEALKNSKGRVRYAQKLNLESTPFYLLDWANYADLLRIKGLGMDYIALAREAGVSTVKELRHRNPQKLLQAMMEANKKSRRPVVRVLPSLANVTRWIEQAKTLPILISY